ncbi:hypothetical protein BCR39DRAFT_138959 [Naematelia encephala]|uniref:BTB domain-containing protein n=1 Tax=Naematelia encephala TaxID=71784 RepID=A0A1Y2BJK7_9TREE|nr:hypothetical protein BCR39DRAFT_138959 [Naematelia encephala]
MSDDIQQPAEKELEYHASFRDSTGVDDVILQSSDGTSFHFDGCLLGHFSTFVKDLRTLPDPTGIMPFPTTSTAAMHHILSHLRNLTTGRRTPRPDLSLVTEVLDFANAYMAPVIALHITSSFESAEDYDPFVVFALAAIARDSDLVAASAEKTLAKGLINMPRWVIDALTEREPRSLIRLYNYHISKPNNRAIFLQKLKRPGLITKKNWSARPSRSSYCDTCKHYSDFDKIVVTIGEGFVERTGNDEPTIEVYNEVASEEIQCKHCIKALGVHIVPPFVEYDLAASWHTTAP